MLRGHTEKEFSLIPGELAKRWRAAFSSFVAFAIGAIIPLVAISTWTNSIRIWLCVVAVGVALQLTGYLSAHPGKAPKRPAVFRNVLIGRLTMGITYAAGRLFGVTKE